MFSPQLALHLYKEEDKKSPKHVGHQYMMFEKHDGWYGYLDFPACVLTTRAQRAIPSCFDISNLIRDTRMKKNLMFRGRLLFEIMIEGYEIDSFHKLNGILNRKEEQVDGVYLRVHDFIHDFKFNMNAHTRYKFAEEVVQRLDIPQVIMSPMLGTSSQPSTWRATAERLWAENKEGIILKRCEGLYEPGKRNYNLMKIKEEVTLELEVIGIEEGQGKYTGTVGNIVARSKNGVRHPLSGMTDKERDDWWNDPTMIIGKVIETKAMKILKDGTLREGRYKAIRFDKTKEDID